MAIKRKLKNRKGFTLAETLLAVLILMLVSVIVARGIPVAKNVYQNVVLAANAQDILATAVSNLRDELGTSWDVRVDDNYNAASGTYVTYFSADTGARSKIFLGDSADGDKEIMLQKNVAVSDLGIKNNAGSTAYALVSDSGATDLNRLYVKYSGVSYNKADHTVVFTGLAAGPRDSRELVKLDRLAIQVFTDKESGS